MKPMTLDVMVAFFCYGGNGGIGMQLPEITSWWGRTVLAMERDPRVGRYATQRLGDVPLTMERNRAVRIAKEQGFDVLVMIDSDNVPDLYVDVDREAKPFWESSFDFLYDRTLKGLASVVCAPYCGPPPHPVNGGEENVYVFYAEDQETDAAQGSFRVEAYSRQQAARMRGIQSVAAGPTGCIMYSVDAFDLMPVNELTKEEVLDQFEAKEITKQRAIQLLNMESWFFYEYTDMAQSKKGSTEDVTNTREIQLAGCNRFGEHVVFCNWDSWAGHYKPKCVGRPTPIVMQHVNELYAEAVRQNVDQHERLVELDFGSPRLSAKDSNDHEEPIAQADPNEKDTPTGTRVVCGTTVTTLGHQTPTNHLEALRLLAQKVSLKNKSGPDTVVIEVGSWVGESAIALHAGIQEQGGRVFCVDTWQGSQYDRTRDFVDMVGQDRILQTFRENVGDRLDNGIYPVIGTSVDMAANNKLPDADLIFLDAGHEYEEVKEDIEAWLPRLKRDGVICGHDFCDALPGVQRAVKELCDQAGTLPNIIADTSIWFITKAELNGQKPTEEIPSEETGVPVTYRMICGRKVKSVGFETPEADLTALHQIVEFVVSSRRSRQLRIVEVGSWVGESALMMLDALGPAGGTIFCVDTWQGSCTDTTKHLSDSYGADNLFSDFCENVGDELDHSIKVVRGESTVVAMEMDPQEIDIVFLDAGHDYASVKADIEAWLPHVASDGVICGHDFCDGFPGVTKAVNECCEAADIAPRLVADATIWFFMKHEYTKGIEARDREELHSELQT